MRNSRTRTGNSPFSKCHSLQKSYTYAPCSERQQVNTKLVQTQSYRNCSPVVPPRLTHDIARPRYTFRGSNEIGSPVCCAVAIGRSMAHFIRYIPTPSYNQNFSTEDMVAVRTAVVQGHEPVFVRTRAVVIKPTHERLNLPRKIGTPWNPSLYQS